MNPTIVAKEAMHFVGVSDTFLSVHSPEATNFSVIPALWGRFCDVAERVEKVTDRVSYGVIFSESERAHPDELRYIAAVRVPAPLEPPDGLMTYSTPAAEFAVVEHRGPVANIGETLREFGRWLEDSTKTRAGGAEIEVYPECYDPAGADAVMETWIPVISK